MKRRLSSVILALVLLASTFTFVLPEPVLAGPPDQVPPGQLEKLEPGWQRTSPHSEQHVLRTFTDAEGKKFTEVEAVISSLPATLDDGRTLIDTNWYLQTDIGNQSWFETGANTFKAKVLDGRVSVEDEDGRLTVWDPVVTIGNEKFTGRTAKIADDPIDSDYKGNCLLWEYGSYSSGWWIFGSSAPLKRYLRVTEGYVSELWILPIDPKSNVYIDLNETVEGSYKARITWLAAFDADYKPLEITKSKYGTYVINAVEFKGKKFPVTVDPTYNFFTYSCDGEITKSSTSYTTARTSVTGFIGDYTVGGIGQYLAWDTYEISRFMVMFYTSFLPDNLVISTATLFLYGQEDGSDSDFYITVRSGMPTYPHAPTPVEDDFYYLNYSGNGGQYYTSSFITNAYNPLELNDTGKSWINKTGWTKFMLHSSEDIAGSEPTGYECVTIRTAEYGANYTPKLVVVGTIPVTTPTCTTLTQSNVTETATTLEGYLDDDGGESCSVRFQYGTSTSYGSDTAWVSGKTTNAYFDESIYGLSPGTTYHYRAQAMNSAGTGSGSNVTFTTLPEAPYNFSATAGDGTVALAWSKGSGAGRTMIRRSSTIPTSPSSGTQIYFDTGTSYNDNTVTNGVEYCYSAWSEKSGVYSSSYVHDCATPSGPSAPSVTTNAATAVTTTTATLNLYLNNLGGYDSTSVYFQYHPAGGSWGDYSTTPTALTAPGSHSAGITGLTTSTLYHQRAVATNTMGTTYGADVPFTTGANYAPTMTTQSATGLQLRGATLNGVVTDDGGVACTAWFEWGPTTSYGTSTPSISGLSTSDTLYYGLTGLEPNTTYHYRVIGQNTIGIGYGADVSFTTSTPTVPTCRTDAASAIGANQAVLNATVLTDGGVECEVRFQYGTTDAYGTDTEWVAGYSKDQTFSKLIGGLTIEETYHFRAQIKNDGGTGSGDDTTFTTMFGAPENFRAKAISSTTINLEWQKSGDQTYIKYKLNGFPIDRADGIVVYMGPGKTASVSGLTAGTTYYFRAWSWREGDVWANECADDVATTQATTAAGEEPLPPDTLLVPDEPETWRQEPSGALLTRLPFYDAGVAFADSYEVPHGTFWFLIAMIIIVVVGVVVGISSRGNVIATTAAGGFALIGCVALGMVTGWLILGYVILSGGVLYLMKGAT